MKVYWLDFSLHFRSCCLLRVFRKFGPKLASHYKPVENEVKFGLSEPYSGTKSSIKKWIIFRRSVRSMFGKQTFAQLRTGFRHSLYLFPQPFWRERKAEAASNRGPSAYQPNALPLGHTGSHWLWGEGGEGGDHNTYRYTVTTRMTPALRWAAMRAILMFNYLWGTKSQDSVHRPQLLKRK